MASKRQNRQIASRRTRRTLNRSYEALPRMTMRMGRFSYGCGLARGDLTRRERGIDQD